MNSFADSIWEFFSQGDKWRHILVASILCYALVSFSRAHHARIRTLKVCTLVWLAGVGLEMSQSAFDSSDVLANTIGCSVAFLLLKRRLPRHRLRGDEAIRRYREYYCAQCPSQMPRIEQEIMPSGWPP